MRGMEINTRVIEIVPGEAQATNRWDRLPAKGFPVFGHGNDDQPEPAHYFIAWNQVQWPQGEPVTPDGIVAALADGRFYASIGVTITRVGVDGSRQRIVVESDASAIHWVSRAGAYVRKDNGGSAELDVTEVEKNPSSGLYVRAVCLGCGNAKAWTQPFWVFT